MVVPASNYASEVMLDGGGSAWAVNVLRVSWNGAVPSAQALVCQQWSSIWLIGRQCDE